MLNLSLNLNGIGYVLYAPVSLLRILHEQPQDNLPFSTCKHTIFPHYHLLRVSLEWIDEYPGTKHEEEVLEKEVAIPVGAGLLSDKDMEELLDVMRWKIGEKLGVDEKILRLSQELIHRMRISRQK